MKVEYVKLYLKKVEAIEKGSEENFEEANKGLIELSERGQRQTQHIVAKEMYKMSVQMIQQKYKKERKKMKDKAYLLFNQAAD